MKSSERSEVKEKERVCSHFIGSPRSPDDLWVSHASLCCIDALCSWYEGCEWRGDARLLSTFPSLRSCGMGRWGKSLTSRLPRLTPRSESHSAERVPGSERKQLGQGVNNAGMHARRAQRDITEVQENRA